MITITNYQAIIFIMTVLFIGIIGGIYVSLLFTQKEVEKKIDIIVNDFIKGIDTPCLICGYRKLSHHKITTIEELKS